MKRVAIAVALCGFASSAEAQNVLCTTRPPGNNTNACATTAFVQSAIAGGLTPDWSNILNVPANVTALAALTGAANTGSYFTGVGTMATYSLTALGRAIGGLTTLTSGSPVIGQGASAPTVGTRTGNTTQFATWTGATTSGRCVELDASGNLVIASAACAVISGFTSGLPLIGQGASPITVGSRTGDTTQYVTWTGATTSGRCAQLDASGNLAATATACGTSAWADITGIPANVTALTGLTGAANTGFYFTASGAMATYSLTALGRANDGIASLTANLPLIGAGASAITTGTRSGNTTAYVTTTGAQTSGNCVTIDGNGNHVAAGASCSASGGGTTQTSTCAAPITVATTDSAIYVNAAGACTINLPARAGKVGAVIIYDNNGTAGSNNYTIVPNGAETINGQASITFAQPYGALVLAPITPGYSAMLGAPLSFTNRALLVGRGSLPPTAITVNTTAGRVLGTTAAGDPEFTANPLWSTGTYAAQTAPGAPSSGQGTTWVDSTQHVLGIIYADGTTSYTAKAVTCGAGTFVNSFNSAGTLGCTTPASTGLQTKIVQFNINLDTQAAGNAAVTGCGFQPTSLQIIGAVDGGFPSVQGMSDSTKSGFGLSNYATSTYSISSDPFYAATSAGNYRRGGIDSYDADGFTINWAAKTGTPTGVVTFGVKCER